ncbi:MAG: hypothetical protein IJB92_01895 [Clostridia bacterium]|nr:hypothetical protein [Clostridia bacterium]
MMKIIELLKANEAVSNYKINVNSKESCELFYVKGRLETVRCTDTCDKEVTVYVNHGDHLGNAQFFVYPSMGEEEIKELIAEAVEKALLINNKPYTLPEKAVGEYTVESNFSQFEPMELAKQVADSVFAANNIENASLNAVEIFINKHTERVINSLGLDKTQVKYDAMVEAIPTYNGKEQSVELYQQYNFAQFDRETVKKEISDKLYEVKARYEAVKPEEKIDCSVVLIGQELAMLMRQIAYDLNYSSVYSHANLFKKGDHIQKDIKGDAITITMAGEAKGNIRSSKFDEDGMALGSIKVVENGKAINYFGANRFGQYLGETPTGSLGCTLVDAGTADESVFSGKRLEVISMSGLQVDFYSDYIGGEVRLAYYYDGEKMTPVTGISITGKLSDVLNNIRLSKETTTFGGYIGPKKALISDMTVF